MLKGEAVIQDADKGIILDVRRKVKLAMRFSYAPLLLEFGRRFAIICSAGKNNRLVSIRFAAAQHGEKGPSREGEETAG